MSVLASETQNKVNSCRGALHAVERHLEPLFAKNLSEVSRKLAPLENAELQVGLAYTVASLYFCNLLTQGTDPSEHPIRQELDRIQLYFKKLKTTAEEVRDKETESSRLRVDAEVAKRIVQHYTGAADAASQRQASSSSVSLVPPPAPAEDEVSEVSPKKKRRVELASEAEATDTADPAIVDSRGRSAEDDSSPQDAPVSTTTTTVEAIRPDTTDAVCLDEQAPVAKVPVAKAPVAKAPVAKVASVTVQPTPSGKAPSKAEGKAQLRPLAAPMAPAVAAKIPQGTAADTILARAKADAQRAKLKKKKRKVVQKGAVDSTSAEVSTPVEEVAVAVEDPYAVAMDDPYAS